MKRYLITLIFFWGLFNRVWAQSPSAAIDSLVKYQIITAQERPVLEKELNDKGNTPYRIAILGGMESVLLQKKYHLDPHTTASFHISYGSGHLTKKRQDSINTTLHILLDKINKAGLLTDRVYNYTLTGIDTGRYVIDLQMLGSLREMSARLEYLAPNKLLPVAQDLHKSGIVDDSSFVRLEDDIRNGKIESTFQLNDYCKLARVFDLTKYSDNPDVWLEQMHRDIASIVPGLNFTNFSYTTIPDTSFSIPGIKFKVSLVCNGRVYKHISQAFNTFRNKQGKITPKDIFAEDFYRIFNKVLADQHSPLQLHSEMFSAGSTTNDQFGKLALIALTEEQAEVFRKESNFSYMSVSMDSYDPTLTSAKIDSTVAEWQKIGLFAHLSSDEISKATDNAEADNLFSMSNLLANFPGVIYAFDSDLMSPDPPYANFLKHLAQITHGAFKPIKIDQQRTGNGVKLQYLFNGKIHSHTFNTSKGWFDTSFPQFIKQLSEENNLPGSFYQLQYEDAVIYLTKQQHYYVVKHKLLAF